MKIKSILFVTISLLSVQYVFSQNTDTSNVYFVNQSNDTCLFEWNEDGSFKTIEECSFVDSKGFYDKELFKRLYIGFNSMFKREYGAIGCKIERIEVTKWKYSNDTMCAVYYIPEGKTNSSIIVVGN